MSLVRSAFALGIWRRNGQFLNRDVPAFIVVVALGLLVWLRWAGTGTRGEMQLAAQRAVRVAELRGIFAHLDEWLTMSAHIAAVTGEPRWAARYDEAGALLTAAVAEAVALATPEVRAALEATTTEASAGLVMMVRASLAMAVVGLSQSLGLTTVAEGVEEPETAALLRNLGCDIGQGWLFGRPGPAEAAGALLQRRTDMATCIT